MGLHISKLHIPEDEEQRPAKIFELVTECVPHFKETPHKFPDDVVVSVLSGGITNQLYRVKSTKDKGESVVVRVFGKETDRIISREAEVFWQGKFLRTFGKCDNALVYEFLEGHAPLDWQDMGKWKVPIATVLARFHHRAAEARLFSPPYSHEPNFCNVFLTEWVSVAIGARAKLHTDRPQLMAAYDALKIDTLFKAEAQWLLGFIADKMASSPSGPCHNDLLCANIMVRCGADPSTPHPQEDVKLIDFEYTKNNYLLHDVANHINEYAGFDCEWSHFPSDEEIGDFGEAYVKALAERCGSENVLLQPEDEEHGTAAMRPTGVVPMSKATLVRHVKFFTLTSNFCWAVWAVIQGAYSAIDFDYMTYAKRRWERYLATKYEFSAKL